MYCSILAVFIVAFVVSFRYHWEVRNPRHTLLSVVVSLTALSAVLAAVATVVTFFLTALLNLF